MRRYGWVLTVLIVGAFFIFQHRSVPSAPTPTNAVTTSQGMRIPVVTEVPSGTGEVWILAQKADKTYVVNAYNRQTLLHVFMAGKKISADSTGTTYSASNDIRLGYIEYQATAIHVNPDGKSGYIELKQVASPGNSVNQPASSNAP
ncbi:hypothetical protein JZ785_12005 [Alicyclobacillus curvatus]|nr:hypothetical protein JZ785_12005 [Alicyclobacillus curvatus]